MTLKAALATALLALFFSFNASADTLSADSPYFETDTAGRSVMP
jgi:hypothetical protein